MPGLSGEVVGVCVPTSRVTAGLLGLQTHTIGSLHGSGCPNSGPHPACSPTEPSSQPSHPNSIVFKFTQSAVGWRGSWRVQPHLIRGKRSEIPSSSSSPCGVAVLVAAAF